jgi:hypothetical protein
MRRIVKRIAAKHSAVQFCYEAGPTELGAALGQERIYVAFADRTWILDAGERCG